MAQKYLIIILLLFALHLSDGKSVRKKMCHWKNNKLRCQVWSRTRISNVTQRGIQSQVFVSSSGGKGVKRGHAAVAAIGNAKASASADGKTITVEGKKGVKVASHSDSPKPKLFGDANGMPLFNQLGKALELLAKNHDPAAVMKQVLEGINKKPGKKDNEILTTAKTKSSDKKNDRNKKVQVKAVAKRRKKNH